MPTLSIAADRLTKHFTTPRPLGQLLRRPRDRSSQQVDRRITAVEEVSFQVQEGELFGLLGPNGAGKTTLIKLLCTLIVPSSGRAHIAGVDLSQAGKVRELIGMASGDERSFYWRLDGRQNLAFFAALYGLPPARVGPRVEELLRQVGLQDEAGRPFRTYSSGQKQRLSIARALLHRPRVLFLDEPTRSLDPTSTLNLHRFILQDLVGRQEMTVFLTTHRLDEAQRLCHRIAIMHKAHIRACGTPQELRAGLQPGIAYALRVAALATEPELLGQGLPGRLRATAAETPGVWILELEANQGESVLALLIDRIVAAQGQIQEIERREPTLEQVFERFTQG